MSTIFGLAGLSASDYQFVNTAGQSLIYTATQQYLDMVNEDVTRAVSVFVDVITEDHQERYQLPGGGRMTQRGDGTRGPAVKPLGSWDVAYPIYDFAEQVAATDVDAAYLTPAEYQRHVDTIVNRYRTELRWQILHALLDNVSVSYSDKRWGTLTLQPLANNDSVTYPPVMGATTDATDNHYLESNYAATAISDSNNPYITIREEIVEHFGTETGGDNVVVFINNAETPETEDLTDFDPVEDRFIRSGANRDIPFNLPNVPGRIIGRTNGVWVSEWRFMPANYMLGIHLDAPAPCKMRVDEAATGLPRGLNLVANDMSYPIASAEWRARFGISVANRLNGVVMELGTGGTYTVPAVYD